ncbi:MAG: AAA family ATPase [Planctomycetales bacterium]|nr:AAA family ATPase [Planctomycetales bacterium]
MPLFAERYQAEQLLSRTRYAVSWLGRDLTNSQRVVIKTLHRESLSAAAAVRLVHEGRVLRQVRSPSLRPVIDQGTQDELHFLVMPFVDGVPLSKRLAAEPLSLDETLAVGRDLLQALHAAHHRGVLHRDVKPANLIVNEADTVHGATLIDFGLAHSDQLTAAARAQPVGTARYVAPEQAGLLNYGMAEPADLYSAGLVLYECVCGKSPFTGSSRTVLLGQQMTVQPRSLRALGLDVPRALDELIQRLIRKDPRQRYQTAEAALLDWERVTDALTAGQSHGSLIVGVFDRRHTLTEPAFVGRQRELEELEAHLRGAHSGAAGLVLLEGDSGVGKTRLLEELERSAAQHGFWIWRTQATAMVAQSPFQLLAPFVERLIEEGQRDAEWVEWLRQELDDQRAALCAALPRLGSVLGTEASGAAGPEAFGESRTLQAIAQLFATLGSAARPALIVIDDCQWADDATLKLLRQWQRRCESLEGVCHSVIVASFRSDEVPFDHPLRQLEPTGHTVLEPLDSLAIRQMAESMAGQLPPDTIHNIDQIANGNPFLASAVLRGMVESAALVADDEGWRIDEARMRDIGSSRRAADFLARRVELLPHETREVLTIAAVVDKEFDVAVVTELARQCGIEDVLSALHEARRRQLLWARPSGFRFAFVHERIRQSLLERLSPERRRDLNLQAAEYLEKNHPDEVFHLAHFFAEAGVPRRAAGPALLAARMARGQHALADAERQYRIAERGSDEADAATRYEIALGLGDVLMLRGEYAEAERWFRQARDLAFDTMTSAECAAKVGELAFKRGDMKQACESLEEGLRLLGRGVSRTHWGLAWRLAGAIARQTLHSLFPKWFLGRRSLENSERVFLAIRLYCRLGYAYWFERGSAFTLWTQLAGMNLAELYPPTSELAQAYSEHAVAISMAPRWFSRGAYYAETSLAIRERFSDRWGRGQSLSFWGALLYSAARFEDCIDKCRESVRLLERTGDYWEMNIARYHIAACHYRLGHLAEAVREVQAIHESGVELGDAQATAISFDLWAKAAPSAVSLEAMESELERPRHDAQGTSQLLQGIGAKQLHGGEFQASAAAFGKAYQIATDAGVSNVWTAPVLAWRITSMRNWMESLEDLTPSRRNQIARSVRRELRRARWVAWWFPNERPHVLREAALSAAGAGRIRKALRLLEQSLDVARRQHAKYEYARSLVARGRIRRELDWPHAEAEWIDATNTLEAIESEVARTNPNGQDVPEATLSLADRFDTVLNAGRQIASELSRERIFASVLDAAQKLLRAELCHLWEVSDGVVSWDDDASAADLRMESVESNVQAAIAARSAVAFDEHQPAATSDAVSTTSVRSALCAPIIVHREIVACLYVAHYQVAGLFGEEEERLADFITTLAGAALENADNYSRLEKWNEELEAIVSARTADAEARADDLARSNEELEQFAYVVSHDMQEPLRTIASYCQLLSRRYGDQLDDMAREFIGYAVDGAERMRKLIADLLSYSRVGTRGSPFRPVDCQTVMQRVEFNLRVMLEESQTRLTYDALPVIMADETQIMQLLQNLVSNAVKFRGSDSPRVHVGVERSGSEWVFSVRDNGIGIDPQHFERIFLIFQRLHQRGQYEGTGIGLAVCKKTVERHGGKIWVDSSAGRGSTFFFTIPHRQLPSIGSGQSPWNAG